MRSASSSARGSSSAARGTRSSVTEPHDGVRRRTPADGLRRRGRASTGASRRAGCSGACRNPNETPGPAREVDWPYLRRMERRLHRLVPVTARARHPQGVGGDDRLHARPSADPGAGHHDATARRIDGATVALARRPRDDVGTRGRAGRRRPRARRHDRRRSTSPDCGMDRFDEHGRSPFYDPIALPFPVSADAD